MNLIAAWPRMMEPELVVEYVRGQKILDDLLAKKLLSPRVQGKGFTRYDLHDVDAALDAWKGFDE